MQPNRAKTPGKSAGPSPGEISNLHPIQASESATEPVKLPPPVTWQQLSTLDECELQEVAMFIRVLENSHVEAAAPADDLIRRLVLRHWYRALTPKIVNDEADEFTQNFAMAADISREFIRFYPETMRRDIENIYGRPAEGGK